MAFRSSFTPRGEPSTTADQSDPSRSSLWSRQVIAEPLQWGHAVWCADLDADGDDELIIGQRDPNKPGATGPEDQASSFSTPSTDTIPLAFDRHTIDDGGMACEDAVAADLDGDGRIDIIAGGRATHNVKIYWNRQIFARFQLCFIQSSVAGRSFLQMNHSGDCSNRNGVVTAASLLALAGALSSAQTTGQSVSPQSKTDPKINDAFKGPTSRLTSRGSSLRIERYTRGGTRSSRHLELKPGMAVADIGAGTGLFTRLMAEKVGASGKVYAVDIAPEFLAHIAADAKKHRTNADRDGAGELRRRRNLPAGARWTWFF